MVEPVCSDVDPAVAVAPVLVEHERKNEEDDAHEFVDDDAEEEAEDGVALFFAEDEECGNAAYREEDADADDGYCLFHLSVVLLVEHGGTLACSTYRSINRQKQPLRRLADWRHDAQMGLGLLIGIDAKTVERFFFGYGAAPAVEVVVYCTLVGVVGTLVVAVSLAEG